MSVTFTVHTAYCRRCGQEFSATNPPRGLVERKRWDGLFYRGKEWVCTDCLHVPREYHTLFSSECRCRDCHRAAKLNRLLEGYSK